VYLNQQFIFKKITDMKKLFLVFTFMLSMLFSFAQKVGSASLKELYIIKGKEFNATLNYIKNLDAVSRQQLAAKLEMMKKEIERNNDLVNNDQYMRAAYSVMGYNNLQEFKDATAKVNQTIATYVKQTGLDKVDETTRKNALLSDYEQNKAVYFFHESLKVDGDRCKDRCISSYGACIGVAYGTFAAGVAGCATIVFPPLAIGCAAGFSLAYAGGLVLCSNTNSSCIEACPGSGGGTPKS
jgi:hypothetical protein